MVVKDVVAVMEAMVAKAVMAVTPVAGSEVAAVEEATSHTKDGWLHHRKKGIAGPPPEKATKSDGFCRSKSRKPLL